MKKNSKIDKECQKIVSKLREIAEEQNISQNKLAELTGINQPNIARFFSPRHAPNMRTLVLIAGVLNYKLELIRIWQNVKEC